MTTVVTIPAAVAATMGGQTYGQQRFDDEDASDQTGSTFVVLYGPPRWLTGLRSQQALSLLAAGEWEAWLLKLRGKVNVAAIHDFLRPQPLGTMRSGGGSVTLGAAAAIGATTAVLHNVIGTLVRGDWLQLGTGYGTSQRVKVTEPATSAVSAAGTFAWTLGGSPFAWTLGGSPFTWTWPGADVTITFEPPLRTALAVGSAVVWDQPVTYYRLTSSSLTWQARANGPAMDGFAADFMETWEP